MHQKLLLALAALSISTVPVLAQEVSAGITGRVTDPSGGAIVTAAVTAKDIDRGTDWPTKTNEDGIYAFPRIPIGRYELRVEAAGFKVFTQTNIVLEVNQRARVDVVMTVGTISESVSVVGEGVVLQTDTTQVGSVVTANTIANTPLISRNPIALTLLTAGVTTPDATSFNNGQRTGGGGRPYVNGNREEGNNFLLDGVDNNQPSDNLTAYQPNPDAIEEFKLITNNASAEFGNFQGGIINVVIKSGTNQFHGNVFEDFRNDKLNANNWARNWQSTPTAPLRRQPMRWNQFGGTYGGPIIKDKLFFFGDYQGLRQATPTSLTSFSVIPMAWRTGDFSSLLSQAKVVQLYNPFALNTTTGLRASFPGNIIPASLIDPAAGKLLNNTTYYPAPQNSLATNNYNYAGSSQINTDQGDIKLDWRPSDKDYFSSRYSHGRQDQPAINSFPLLYNTFNVSPFQNGVINWTRTISPTLINEARVGVNDILLKSGGADKGLGNIAQTIGIQNAGLGLMSLQGFANASNIGSQNVGIQSLFGDATYHYADNLTIIHGRHMMKTGGQLLRQDINTFYSGNNGRTGYFDFTGRFTAVNAASPTGTLIGEADLLLGLPADFGRGLSGGNTWGHRGNIYGVYFQDDWRVTNNLTLNLGLRWEYHSPWVEVKDRQANFTQFGGQLELAGKDGNSRSLFQPYKKDFQPRIGFAYNPNLLQKKLVVRGAYTVSSFLEGTGTNLRLPMNPPYNSETTVLYNTPAFTLPATTLDQGFTTSTDPYYKATIRLWDPLVRPAEVQQWNVSTEYMLPGSNLLTVGYIGQHGTHLMVAMPYLQNRIVNGAVVTGDYFAGNPTLRKDISQISGTASIANQKYNAMQATVRRRLGMGLEYQFAYTWSHGMSDSIGYYGQSNGQSGSQSAYWQNLYNQRSEWGPTYFDVRHNLVGSIVYEIPVGKGKHFGTNMNRAVDGVVGGWQLGGIFTKHTGFPLTIKVSGDPSGTGARSFRANVVGTPHDLHQIGPGAQWLDLSAYATPTAYTFGNAGVGIVNGPGMTRVDLSLSKRFSISEKRYFELRGEAFNLSNTPIFLSPASQTISSTLFGQIRSSNGERNMQVVAKFYF